MAGRGRPCVAAPVALVVLTHFEVDSEKPIAAGIDGEALVLDAPLEFRIRPKVLQVRVARQHPGASPSAMAPEGVGEAVVELMRIAFGRHQKP